MPASSSKPRTYNEKYLGRNGFTEKPTTRAQKLEVHQHALDIIRHCGVRLPRQVPHSPSSLVLSPTLIIEIFSASSVETIMNTDWTKPAPETSASVQKEIDELRKRHGALLSRLYDLNASAYLDDVEDRYRSRNEVLDEDPREWMKREFKDSPKALGVNYSQAEVDAMIQISNAQKVCAGYIVAGIRENLTLVPANRNYTQKLSHTHSPQPCLHLPTYRLSPDITTTTASSSSNSNGSFSV